MKNWIINNDGEVDCIVEIIKQTKKTLQYKNHKDERVAIDKDCIKYYEDLAIESQGFVIGSLVQYYQKGYGWCKKPWELVKIFPNFSQFRRVKYLITNKDRNEIVERIRLYDERLLAIEREKTLDRKRYN